MVELKSLGAADVKARQGFWAAFASVCVVVGPSYTLFQVWQIASRLSTNYVDAVFRALDSWGVILILASLTLFFIASPLESRLAGTRLERRMPFIYLAGFAAIGLLCIPGAILLPYSANTLFIAIGVFAFYSAVVAFPARFLYPRFLPKRLAQWTISTSAILLALAGPILPSMFPAEYKALTYFPSQQSGELARVSLSNLHGSQLPTFITHQAQNPSVAGVHYQMAVGCEPTTHAARFVAEAYDADSKEMLKRMDFNCHANLNGGSASETLVAEVAIPHAGTRLRLRLIPDPDNLAAYIPMAFVAVARSGSPW